MGSWQLEGTEGADPKPAGRTTRAHDADAGLVAALRRAGVAHVDASSRRRAEYSTDASLYRVLPRVVVFPRSADEVAAALQVCRSMGVPLTTRGAGTSVAGNAVGPGVVLDLSRHLDRVTAVDPDTATATVQPGVVLDRLQEAAAPHGLRFGPDPSTHDRCTVGGMIGNNACGARALAYGRTADNVVALDVLTGSGQRLTAGRGADPASSATLTALHDIVQSRQAVIRTELGRFPRQVSGYSLEHLLPERDFDVAKALVGTEGSCGIVLSASVRLQATPASTVLAVLGYPGMAEAADAVPALLGHRPLAIEGLDVRIVDAVRRRRGAQAVPPLPRGSAWVFVELGGDAASESGSAASALLADADAVDSVVIFDPGRAAALWRIREEGAGLSGRSPAGAPAHAGWEDAAVPPERLGAYLREFEAMLVDFGLTGMPYGHLGDGCMHVRLDFPLEAARGPGLFRRFLEEAATLVAGYGGSMSGEHGDGRARSELLPRMYSTAALDTFAAFKAAFDPEDVLNPGVVVAPRPLDADLRVPQAHPLRRRLGFAYTEDGGDLTTAVHRCTGIGKCRADTTGAGGVMCPSYLATGDERDSTRGRARVLQEMANGSFVQRGWRSPEVHDVLDLCLSCKGCLSDCPTGVDMASYKAEVLHQSYRHRLRPASHYALGWLPRWARAASVAPKVVNRVLELGPIADVGKRLGGVDTRRPLPRFAERTFRQRLAARDAPAASDEGRTDVVLWADTFTEFFSPSVGIAAVRVLEDAGFRVRVPQRGLCCGLTWISTGQLTTARRVLQRSVDALAPHVAAGTPVVGLEPSCAAVFRGDALELLGPQGGKVEPVATAVHTLAELLARHRPGWRPPALDGVTATAQPHCHQHAVMGWSADRALLERAGATVRPVGGCCGLAGNFGFERGHYDVSVAVAEHALLPAVRAQAEDTVVLADGFSCRTQLEHLASRRGWHLAELLAARLDGDPAGGPPSLSGAG